MMTEASRLQQQLLDSMDAQVQVPVHYLEHMWLKQKENQLKIVFYSKTHSLRGKCIIMLTCYYNLRIVRKYIMFNGSVQHLHLHHKSDLNICKSDPNANIIYLFHRKGCKFFIQASTCQSNKDEQHLCVSINLC